MTSDSQSIVFNRSVPIEVTPAPFVMFDSVRHLDVPTLARAPRAEFEVGYFDTGCHQLVRAVVENGIVTEVRVDPCSDEKAERAPPELNSLLEAAFRRVKRGRKTWQPMPLQRFLGNAQRPISIETITCVQICIFDFCFVCCTTINPDTPFWCGKRVIIHSDLHA